MKLETARMGGQRVTTVEAVRRFFARLNGANASMPSPAQVRRDHERADAELEGAGI